MSHIGPVQLPSGAEDATGAGRPYWANARQWSPVAQRKRRTLGGVQHAYEAPLSGGRVIILQFDDACWLSQATADALDALSALPGTHDYELDGYSATVAFDRDDEKPVNLRPLWPGADMYTGTVKLLEVTH